MKIWTQTQGKYYYHNVNDRFTTWDKSELEVVLVSIPLLQVINWNFQCILSVPVNAMLHDKCIQFSLYGSHDKFKLKSLQVQSDIEISGYLGICDWLRQLLTASRLLLPGSTRFALHYFAWLILDSGGQTLPVHTIKEEKPRRILHATFPTNFNMMA